MVVIGSCERITNKILNGRYVCDTCNILMFHMAGLGLYVRICFASYESCLYVSMRLMHVLYMLILIFVFNPLFLTIRR